MAKASVGSVEEYLAVVAPERQPLLRKLRALLRKNLPKGFEETLQYGMPAYVVPLRSYPNGYHCDPKQPLPFVNLAAQKNYIAFYHMGLYDPELLAWFREQWPKHTEAKLDMGKCCVRLRSEHDVPFDLIGQLMRRMTVRDWIAKYEQSLPKSAKAAKRNTAAANTEVPRPTRRAR